MPIGDSNCQSWGPAEGKCGAPDEAKARRELFNTTSSDSGAFRDARTGQTPNLGLTKIQKSKFAKFENLEKWIFANREKTFSPQSRFQFCID